MTSRSAEAWRALASEGIPSAGELRILESEVKMQEGPALFAVDSAGLRHLLIPVPARHRVEPDKRSGGVHVVGRTLIDRVGHTAFVDVACRKPHLAEIFTHLVDEVLESLAVDPLQPDDTAKRVLNRWRELLERDQQGILSDDAVIGLFGELTILLELARRTPAAVAAWHGPLAARHDFRMGAAALEVKATIAQRVVAHIHGIDQLEAPPGAELFLAVVSLDRTPGSGDSLPSLVARLHGLGVDALELGKKLLDAGYSPHQEAYYSRLQYTQRSIAFYCVDSDFPRIIRSSFVDSTVPPKVNSVSYTIDLSNAPPMRMNGGAAQALLSILSGRADSAGPSR